MDSIFKAFLPSLPPLRTLQHEQSRRRDQLDPLRIRHRVTRAKRAVHWATRELNMCATEPRGSELVKRLQEKEAELIEAQYALEVELPWLTAHEDARVLLENELVDVGLWWKLNDKVNWQRARKESYRELCCILRFPASTTQYKAIEKRLVSKARSLVYGAHRMNSGPVSTTPPLTAQAVLDSFVLDCKQAGLLEARFLPYLPPRYYRLTRFWHSQGPHRSPEQRKKATSAHRRLKTDLRYQVLAPPTAASHLEAKLALAAAAGTSYVPFVRADPAASKRAEKQVRADKRARRKLEKILRKKAILANVAKGVAISRTVSHACSLYL